MSDPENRRGDPGFAPQKGNRNGNGKEEGNEKGLISALKMLKSCYHTPFIT